MSAGTALVVIVAIILSAGIYVCSQCGFELFSSRSKFQHGSIWPAFNHMLHPDSLIKKPEPDRPDAIELWCGKCENRLGHEFLREGPDGESSRF